MYKMWLSALVVLTLGLFPSTAFAEEKHQELVNKLTEGTYTGDLDEIRQRKVLRALVVYSKTDFFFTDELHPRGLQADLLQQLDKLLNAGIKQQELKTIINYIPTTFDNLLNDLEAGRGDIAAHLLTITPERKKRVNFATSGAFKVNELVVAHKGVVDINKPEDLAGRTVYVLKGSSYAEHLRELNANLNKMGLVPVTIIEADPRLRSEDIMELVNAGAVKLTIIDDYKAKLWSRVLPDIQVLENVIIKADTTVGWAVRKNNPKLLESLMALTKTVKKGSLIGNMFFKRYYHSTKWIDNPLSDEKRSKLLDLINLFKKYAGKYSFDYLAIAAQAYQESQLDHSRISPAGALGIMQLLPSTAADPNINIADIKEL
ncbi:MAG: lytic transglycosylase F, partial [Deltaproteobacteria bacterium]|nr:lytic transglycosylase F [Deltaproteobacteria bacterium]